jgi:hypothetical protein
MVAMMALSAVPSFAQVSAEEGQQAEMAEVGGDFCVVGCDGGDTVVGLPLNFP